MAVYCMAFEADGKYPSINLDLIQGTDDVIIIHDHFQTLDEKPSCWLYFYMISWVELSVLDFSMLHFRLFS